MSTIRQLDIIKNTVLRHDYVGVLRIERPTAPPARESGGRFTARSCAVKGIPDAVASVVYAGYFASVCHMMGVDRDSAKAMLAKPAAGAIRVDPDFRRAAYVRQLAMYLTSTEAEITQAQIGRITGLTDAGVHKALRAVEDLRDDHADYEHLITSVLVDVAMNDHDARRALHGRARRIAIRFKKVKP